MFKIKEKVKNNIKTIKRGDNIVLFLHNTYFNNYYINTNNSNNNKISNSEYANINPKRNKNKIPNNYIY